MGKGRESSVIATTGPQGTEILSFVRLIRGFAPRNDNLFVTFLLIGVVGIVLAALAHAGSIESILVLKISAEDERAVIRTSEDQMKIIKVGDEIGEKGRVIEIGDGRVVIEENIGQEIETVIIRLEDGKQRVERVKKVKDKQPDLYAPK